MIDEIISILTDPAHIVAELPYELAFLAMHAGWVKWKFRKRDVEHGHEKSHG